MKRINIFTHLLLTEVRVLLRCKGSISTLLLFTLLITFYQLYSLDSLTTTSFISHSWLTVLMASFFFFLSSYDHDNEYGALKLVLNILPSPAYLYFAKSIISFLLIIFILYFYWSVGVFCGVIPISSLLDPAILAGAVLGGAAFSSIGTFWSAILLTKIRSIFFGIFYFLLLLPVMITLNSITPVISGAAQSSELVLSLRTLIVFDIVFITTGAILFEYIVKD